MISFRFHLVSIVAVFLGVAIGVVVGSTFVDRAIVDGLEDRIDTVSNNLDERRAENDALQSENDRLDDVLEAGAPFAVSGRLVDVPLLVLAVRGIDEETVERLVALARQAGAEVPGILWVEPSWALGEAGQAEQLADLVGVAGGAPERVQARAWDALIDELVAPPESDVTTTTTETTLVPPADGTTSTPTTEEPAATPVLDTLADSPFLSFHTVGDDSATITALAGRGPSVIAVTGTRAEESLAPLLRPLVSAAVDAGLRTVVGEVFVEPGDDATDPPERGEAVRAAIPEELAASVPTADHLDRPEGLIAAVLALADLHHDVVGRYGYGDGTAGPLPSWTALTPTG